MKIVITDGYDLNPGDLDWEDIAQFGEIVYYDTTAPDALPERCAEAGIIIANKTYLGAELIRNAPQLKMIALTATGYNNVDMQAAARAGITVCNVPEYGTFSVAQHTIALLLELVNAVGIHARSVAAGDWTRTGKWCYTLQPLTELQDKVFGIVGFGRIGRQTATLARAFGMRVIFSNRSPVQSDIAEQVLLEQVFKESDVVSLHCPLTAENEGFVNSRYLSMMKPSAYLINTSRGKLINEADLAKALKEGTLAGAGLDVLSAEPPPADHPLTGLANCIITPHIAWSSREARKNLMDTTRENIRCFLAGKPQHVVSG